MFGFSAEQSDAWRRKPRFRSLRAAAGLLLAKYRTSSFEPDFRFRRKSGEPGHQLRFAQLCLGDDTLKYGHRHVEGDLPLTAVE